MRILIYEELKREQLPFATFSWALMRAIDSRMITHRPRGSEKTLLMRELGMDVSMPESSRRDKNRNSKSP